MTEEIPTAIANAEQIESWNNRTGQRWAALQDRIDHLFAPLTDMVLDWAAALPGSRVVDVGCGCGATVLALARCVGPAGSVLGVDVSRPMLEVAERRVAEHGLGNTQLVLADASAHPFAPGSADLVFSRFGVMFFDDPVAAFRHVAPVLRSGGRLAFVCWQPLAANEWFRVPVEAVQSVLPAATPADPDAPGPFAFARPDRVRGILAAAGFSAIAIEPRSVPLKLGDPGCLDAATDFVTQVGAAARLIGEADPSIRIAARAAIRERLAPFDGPEGLVLGGAVWLVSAQAA